MGRPTPPDAAVAPLTGPAPDGTRTVRATRRVRLGDVHPDGRARLDAFARYLQDVAADDVREAGTSGDHRWVVRRTTLTVVRRPVYEEPLEVVTWCSGTGAAWAERRSTVTSQRHGTCVEAASLWVALDPGTLRPGPLGEHFWRRHVSTSPERRVRGRLLLDPEPPPGAARLRWPLRLADFDALGHVNNAIAWAIVDEVAERQLPRPAGGATIEYRDPVEAGAADSLEVATAPSEGGLGVWLIGPGGNTAVVAALSAQPERSRRPL